MVWSYKITVEVYILRNSEKAYCNLVKPILGYSLLIRDQNTANGYIQLEGFEHKFLMYASFILVFNVFVMIKF